MVPGRVQTIELAVHHMRDPGQRMPVAGVAALEGPEQAGPGQPGFDVGIIADVVGVIEVNELVASDRPISDPGRQDEQGANDEDG